MLSSLTFKEGYFFLIQSSQGGKFVKSKIATLSSLRSNFKNNYKFINYQW